MPETVRLHLQQNDVNRNFKVIDNVANGGRWLDADNGHILTSLSDGPGAMSGVLRFGSDDPISGYFAVAVGLRDNNDTWGDVITGPPANQSAQSILEMYNTGRNRDMTNWIHPFQRDVTSADKASITGPKIGD